MGEGSCKGLESYTQFGEGGKEREGILWLESIASPVPCDPPAGTHTSLSTSSWSTRMRGRPAISVNCMHTIFLSLFLSFSFSLSPFLLPSLPLPVAVFRAFALPSAGPLPFLQSVLCDFSGLPEDTPSDMPYYDAPWVLATPTSCSCIYVHVPWMSGTVGQFYNFTRKALKCKPSAQVMRENTWYEIYMYMYM